MFKMLCSQHFVNITYSIYNPCSLIFQEVIRGNYFGVYNFLYHMIKRNKQYQSLIMVDIISSHRKTQ